MQAVEGSQTHNGGESRNDVAIQLERGTTPTMKKKPTAGPPLINPFHEQLIHNIDETELMKDIESSLGKQEYTLCKKNAT